MLLKQDDAKLSVSLEEKIGDKSYRTLFQHFFDQQIAAVLPSADEIGFLDYLPESPDEAAGGVKSEPRGLFSLFGKKSQFWWPAKQAWKICRTGWKTAAFIS